jgi:hypothetical protein
VATTAWAQYPWQTMESMESMESLDWGFGQHFFYSTTIESIDFVFV